LRKHVNLRVEFFTLGLCKGHNLVIDSCHLGDKNTERLRGHTRHEAIEELKVFTLALALHVVESYLLRHLTEVLNKHVVVSRE